MDKQRPTHLTIVPDFGARLEIENRRQAERREEVRRDMANIVYLWAQKCYQREHTERDTSKGGDAA